MSGAEVAGGAFDEFAAFEAGAGAYERDEVGCVDGAPAGLWSGEPLLVAATPFLDRRRGERRGARRSANMHGRPSRRSSEWTPANVSSVTG